MPDNMLSQFGRMLTKALNSNGVYSIEEGVEKAQCEEFVEDTEDGKVVLGHEDETVTVRKAGDDWRYED